MLVLFYNSCMAFGILLFIALCFTDLLDGFIARMMKTESKFGKILDPLADKIFSLSILIMLVDMQQFNTGWEIAIIYAIFFREMMSITIRTSKKIANLGALTISKYKTFVLNMSLFLLLLNLIEYNEALHSVGIIGLFVGMTLGMFSLAKYIIMIQND